MAFRRSKHEPDTDSALTLALTRPLPERIAVGAGSAVFLHGILGGEEAKRAESLGSSAAACGSRRSAGERAPGAAESGERASGGGSRGCRA